MASTLADELREFLDQGGRAVVEDMDLDELAAWLTARGVGKRGGRRRARREAPEAPEVGAAARRFARALARRAAEGDTEALEELVALRGEVEACIVSAARNLHRFNYSWTDIGRVLGMTRQAARQRFAS